MIAQALAFLIDTVGTLLLIALLLRFWLQAARAPYNNPVSGFLAAITDWGVRPLRKVVPGLWGLDLATLTLAWLIAWLLNFVLGFGLRALDPAFDGGAGLGASLAGSLGIAALVAMVQLTRLFLYMLIGAVILQAVLSWVNPYSALSPLLDLLTRPFLRPIQARVKPISGVDLSPLILLIACQLALILVVGGMQRVILSLG
ncbi:MAG: YggT family protein [Proteobacteria bacterium]|nr:YggT family protein [Burkholderiales bacterium]